MRVFHELVVDDYIEGNSGVSGFRLSKFVWTSVLGHFDALRLIVVADRVSGGSPSLSISLFDSPDAERSATLAQDLGSTLVAGQTNVWSAAVSLSQGLPASYASWFIYWLNGTGNPKAHVRIWVTGRDFA